MHNVTTSTVHSDRWEAQLRKGSLDLAILAVLWGERLYGLEILRRLESASLEVAEGTLYPILMRLKQDGLLDSTWVEAEAGHPRKYYWLTRTGRQRALSMAQGWGAFSRSISGLLVGINNGAKER
jgi:PadR family transcriptional regulator, regulatory protein PadR